MLKRALITGASGYLGRHLMESLLTSGTEVYALQHKAEIQSGKAAIIEGGLTALTSGLINEINPDAIFHCARPVLRKWGRNGRSIAAMHARRLNNKLLTAIEKSKPRPQILFASGSLLYGNGSSPHLEDAPLNPVSYARQYFKGEIPLNNALESGRCPIKILRFPWLLGNGSWFLWFYFDMIRKYSAVPLFGDGKNMMSLLDVQDAAELMTRYATDTSEPGIYNIYSPYVMNQRAFLDKTAAVFDVTVKPWNALYRAKPEKEAIEAFTSNIILGSRFTEILDGYDFISVEKSLYGLKKILKPVG